MKKLISLVIIALFVTSCYTVKNKYVAEYEFELSKVQKSVNNLSDKTEIQNINNLQFSDSIISIKWEPSTKGYSFVLSNKSNGIITLDWNDVIYINTSGNSCKVIHQGVKYADRNNQLTSSKILPESKLDDIIIPSENVFWREGFYSQYGSISGGWEVNNIFPKEDYNLKSLENRISLFEKIDTKILLPIQSNNIVYNYIFSFIPTNTNIITVKEKNTNYIGTALLGSSLSIAAVFLLYSSLSY